jgi:hypothetical protein
LAQVAKVLYFQNVGGWFESLGLFAKKKTARESRRATPKTEPAESLVASHTE